MWQLLWQSLHQVFLQICGKICRKIWTLQPRPQMSTSWHYPKLPHPSATPTLHLVLPLLAASCHMHAKSPALSMTVSNTQMMKLRKIPLLWQKWRERHVPSTTSMAPLLKRDRAIETRTMRWALKIMQWVPLWWNGGLAGNQDNGRKITSISNSTKYVQGNWIIEEQICSDEGGWPRIHTWKLTWNTRSQPRKIRGSDQCFEHNLSE